MEEKGDTLKLEGVFSKGYGIIPKLVMKDLELSIEAKAIYSYIASYAGNGESAFPSVKKICYDLQINEKRFNRHKKALFDKGYIEVTQERKGGGKFASNVYTIKHFVKPTTQNRGADEEEPPTRNGSSVYGNTDKRHSDNGGTNNNSSTNNSITNNNNKKDIPPKSKKRIYETDSIYYKLASELFEKIRINNGEAKKPDLQKWSDEIRKMAELDNRKPEQIRNMINWCQTHEFWSGIILSAGKLREKYDQMRVQANQKAIPKKTYNNSQPIRKETMPEWHGKPAVNEKPMDAAAQAELQARLEKIRAFGK